jgi:hypothetical protein
MPCGFHGVKGRQIRFHGVKGRQIRGYEVLSEGEGQAKGLAPMNPCQGEEAS